MLGANYLLVRAANLRLARAAVESDLRSAVVLFDQVVRGRVEQLAVGARLLSDDWAFRQLFGSMPDRRDPVQRRTLLSGLENYRSRFPQAAFLQLVDPEGRVLADTSQPEADPPAAFEQAWLLAQAEESPDWTATAFAVHDGRPALLLVAPIRLPDLAGWIVVGFAVDAALAGELKRLAGVEVTFAHEAGGGWRPLVSTRPAGRPAEGSWAGAGEPGELQVSAEGAETWLGVPQPLPGDGRVRALLQRDLGRALAPWRRLEGALLLLTAGALAVSALLAARLAGGISRPVSELTRGVQRVEQGRYDEPVPVRGRDELAALGAAFNRMSAGLAERDRVRDLLGKAVSPAIAAELMRRPPELGGEERDVTVLFTDLRGFTAYSERTAPATLVGELNDYFGRITAVVERHGGIVDKFIGDAVMAVFGAPVAQADHAARALDCAEELLADLAAWSRARAAAGRPTLGTGIGVASGPVVAGNLGSAARHNYTVLGDAVNLASRLQDLTKEWGEACLVAGDTVRRAGPRDGLRALGERPVRGRAAPIAVYALAGPAEPTSA